MNALAQPVAARRSRVALSAGRGWWPLAVLTLLAAVLRISTLDLQSFWYDEAFTPVHVLHPSLWDTLHSVSHTENSPPLWYVLEWIFYRLFGDGEVSLRMLSALAGIATVPLAWGIGRELCDRRAAIGCALLVAVNPLFFWYSQEARVYALFALMVAAAMLCFLRALREPTPARMAAFALTASLALLTHYFAVFLLAAMAGWLLYERRTRRAALPALAAIGVVGLALLPLISAQGGHGTQWIGRWALSSRLQAIPQYWLSGYSGSPLGHGVELLVALPVLAAVSLGLWRLTEPRRGAPPELVAARERCAHGATIAATLTAAGVLAPVLLAILGADYLAPRNLLGAMIPLTALVAVLACAPGAGLAGAALLGTLAAGFLALSIDVDLSPRLQRGNWRGVVQALPSAPGPRVFTVPQLGSAPLEYYVGRGLHNPPRGTAVTAREVVEIGYSPLRSSAGRPPARGFVRVARLNVDGLIVYRFVAPAPTRLSEQELRAQAITLAHPEVLVARTAS
jgi:4-amino-4-deoxy-L-arabinose transferase-like glycosyltransferase